MTSVFKSVLKILITAGATREMLDPVRFLSNLSSGKMGYILAEKAQKKGHKTILISAPTNLSPPKEIKFISVVSALEMQSVVREYFLDIDCLIMASAVSDYRPLRVAKEKIKKGEDIVLRLKQNPDILLNLKKEKGKKILVGFSLESQDWLENSRKKLFRKDLDFIVANKISRIKSPFGKNRISGAILDKNGTIERFNSVEKKKIAETVIKKVEDLYALV